MATTKQSNEEIIEDFLNYIHQTSKYWAKIKLQEIRRGTRRSLSIAQAKLLKELMLTDDGKEALRMLLLDFNDSNVFTILDYIDGGTGVRPLELINDETRESITIGALHESWTAFDPSKTTSKLVL